MCRQLPLPFCIKLACASFFLFLSTICIAQSWSHPEYHFEGMVSINGNIAAYIAPRQNENSINLDNIKIQAFGTGKEVGEIARVNIFNGNDVTVYVRFADAILTSPKKTQNYVTLDTTDFLEIQPQSSIQIYRTGTCYEPSKKHLTSEDEFNSPDEWIPRADGYSPERSADRIFEISETIYKVTDYLTQTGSLNTPFHGEAGKERLTMALHAHKYLFSRESQSTKHYIKEDFIKLVSDNFKKVTGSKYQSLAPSLKAIFQEDLNLLWSTIVTIGQRTKARVDQLPQKLKIEKERLKYCELISIQQVKRHDADSWNSSAAAIIQCQIAKNQGPQLFNLWVQGDNQITKVIHNLPLPCSGRKANLVKGFQLPIELINAEHPLQTIEVAHTMTSSTLTSTIIPDSFYLLKISPSIKYISNGNKDLNSVDDMFPKGTKVGEVEDPSIDFEDFRQIDRQMPNMDMDGNGNPPSKGFAGDENGCVPAAFSNSMMWMRDSHEVVKNTLDKHFHREPHGSKIDDKTLEELRQLDSAEMHHHIFEEASRLMKREDRKGVWMQEFIRGKQSFMDKYQLPIKVKYQSTRVKADKICPEPDLYGHCAENQNKKTDDKAPNGKVDIQWILKELQDDEDVELNLYCFKIDENGEFVRNDKGKITPTIEHCVTVSGISSDGKKYHHLILSDDGNQMNEGGTKSEDVHIIEEDDDAHPNLRGMLRIQDLSYAYEDEVCYVMQVVSESVDPSITFEKKPEELDQEESFNYLDDYWRKSNIIEDVLKQNRKIPWWAWTAGGGVLTGTAIYLLNEEDDDVKTLVNDEAMTISCMGMASINVLSNDVGKGLELIQIDVESGGSASFTKDGLITIIMATKDLVIRYTVRDQDGQEYTGVLNVTVLPDSVVAQDDSYEINQGDVLVRNILENDVGNGLQLKSHGVPQGGQLTSNTDGLINFTPNSDFIGTTSFDYILEGKCGGMDSTTVTITVIDTTCEINVDATIEHELCDLTNGRITLQVTPAASYEYQWSNGETTRDITDLADGTYSVTISKASTTCQKDFTFSVDENVFDDYISDLSVTPYSCLSDGEISFTLSSPGSGDYRISINGPNGLHQEDTDKSQITISEFISVVHGSYTVTVYDLSLGDVCSETTTVEIQDKSPPLSSEDDHYILEPKDTIRSNILTNDAGEGLSVLGFEQPTIGTADISADGELSFFYTGTFSGVIEFDYYVIDTCDRRDTASIHVEILKQGCDFDFTVSTQPAMCGQMDGNAQITTSDTATYEITWSNGDTTYQIDALAAGDYTVTLIDTNGCEITKSLTIPNIPQRIADTVITASSNCLGRGEMTIVIDSTIYDTFSLTIKGPNVDADTLISGTILHLHDWLKIDSGSYELLLKEAGLPDSCCQRINLHIGKDTADFEIIISTEAAFCGSATGKASARISPIGNYSYLWSTGDQGRNVDGLGEGSYELTVTDEDSGCTKSQSFEIENDLASDFVQNEEIIPAVCNNFGDIVLQLSTPATGDLRITGSGPGTTINLTVPPGQVRFSDFIMVSPGNYQHNIWDEGVGPACTQRLDVMVPLEDEDIALSVVSSQEPSGPTASDGSITCLINASPFSAPFQIFLNGAPWSTTTSPNFTISNLGVGSYDIYVVSAVGCISNEVTVEFDLSPLKIQGRLNTYSLLTTTDAFLLDQGKVPLTTTPYFMTSNLQLSYTFPSQLEFRSSINFVDLNPGFAIGGGLVRSFDDVTVHFGSQLNWLAPGAPKPGLYLLTEWPRLDLFDVYLDFATYRSNDSWPVMINGGLNVNLR